jgi:hypothetical protein
MEGNVLGGLFGKRNEVGGEPVTIPAALQPEDPVNYNSVLDYVVGLSDKDYKTMTASAEIYRDANKKVAKLLGIKDEPTTTISTERPEIGDDELDAMLAAEPGDLAAAFIDDAPVSPKPKKAQSTERKIEVKE